MQLSESEKEAILQYVFPMFESFDTELKKIYDSALTETENILVVHTGYGLNKTQKEKIKFLLHKYGSRETIISTIISLEQYYDPESNENSFKTMVEYIGKICFTRSKNKYGNIYGVVNYIVKIAKNNLNYVNEKSLKNILFKYLTIDNMEKIKNIVSQSKNWTSLKQELCTELKINSEKI